MKFGNFCCSYQLSDDTHTEVIARFIRLGEMSERLGFDTFWLQEHHFTEFALVGNAYTAAANLLGRTKNIHIGTMGLVLPTAHPARQLEDILLLAQLSKGRFCLGFSHGLYDKDFSVFGGNMTDARGISQTYYRLLMQGQTTGQLCIDNKQAISSKVKVYPQAYGQQTKGVPICITAASAGATQWAAMQGLPIQMSWVMPTSEKQAQMAFYNEVATSHGHDISKIEHSMVFICVVDKNGDKARDLCREFLVNWYDSYIEACNTFKALKQEYNIEQTLWQDVDLVNNTNIQRRIDYSHDINPVGTPEECIEVIQRDIDATGITHIICGFEASGSEADIFMSMQQFITQIAPCLKEPENLSAMTNHDQ